MGQTPDTNDTAPTKNTTVPFALETAAAWRQLMEDAGLKVEWVGTAPMALLKVGRNLRDEGLRGALRMAMRGERARASSSAVYALFSFIAVPFLVFILPRMFFSLHPSPVLNETGRIDMDAVMLGTLVLSLIDMTLIYIWLMKRGEPNA